MQETGGLTHRAWHDLHFPILKYPERHFCDALTAKDYVKRDKRRSMDEGLYINRLDPGSRSTACAAFPRTERHVSCELIDSVLCFDKWTAESVIVHLVWLSTLSLTDRQAWKP